MQQKEKKLVNDEIDLVSLFSVILDNFNFLFSVLLTSFLISTIYYLSATKLYESNSLLEIKQTDSTSFLPDSLRTGLSKGISADNSLEAEIEIYKSNSTVLGALDELKKFNDEENLPSPSYIKSNLSLESKSKSLITISFVSDDMNMSTIILDHLNNEFIKDRRDFVKQSSAAGLNFIQS